MSVSSSPFVFSDVLCLFARCPNFKRFWRGINRPKVLLRRIFHGECQGSGHNGAPRPYPNVPLPLTLSGPKRWYAAEHWRNTKGPTHACRVHEHPNNDFVEKEIKMKTQSIGLALAMVTFFPIASAQWFTLNSGTTKNLNGVCFTDASTGTVVGDSGTILRTTDGGTIWTVQTSGTSVPLYAVYFTHANTGTAVGASGIIIHTMNGGATWMGQSNETTVGLFAVSFTDANTGTAVGGGGTFLRTANAGVNWISRSSGTLNTLHAVCFKDASTGIAVGDSGTVLRTSNGGSTWSMQSIGTTIRLAGVSFSNAAIGATVGWDGPRYVFAHTIDSGGTWTIQSGGRGAFFHDVAFSAADRATAVGWWAPENGFMRTLHIADSGATWVDGGNTFPSGVRSLRAVCFTDSLTGTAVGSLGVILRTTTGGVTWIEGADEEDVPKRSILSQNYPNPFNPSTTIRFGLPQRSLVNLAVYNMLGQQVAQLVGNELDAGLHEVKFDGTGFSSGVYFYQLKTGDFTLTKRLMLLK